MANETVLYRAEGDVAVITLNRPKEMNRIDSAMVDGLHDAWVRFMASDERVAVVNGAGEKAFCAGADLAAPPANLYYCMPSIGVPVDKPVIAATHGWVVGGGMVLTTMCDLMICADTTRFSYPEVKVGLSGGLISNLATRIPHKIAMELLLVGEPMSVQRAYEVGYVNKVVPAADLMNTAMEWAKKIAATAPLPSRMLKRFSLEALPKGPSEIAGIARVQVEAVTGSADAKEGPRAFVEKRPPVYKGK